MTPLSLVVTVRSRRRAEREAQLTQGDCTLMASESAGKGTSEGVRSDGVFAGDRMDPRENRTGGDPAPLRHSQWHWTDPIHPPPKAADSQPAAGLHAQAVPLLAGRCGLGRLERRPAHRVDPRPPCY